MTSSGVVRALDVGKSTALVAADQADAPYPAPGGRGLGPGLAIVLGAESDAEAEWRFEDGETSGSKS